MAQSLQPRINDQSINMIKLVIHGMEIKMQLGAYPKKIPCRVNKIMKNISISVVDRVLRSFICGPFDGYDRALSMLHAKFTDGADKYPLERAKTPASHNK